VDKLKQLKEINKYLEYRLLTGLNREEAAKKIGISESYLEKIEYGYQQPGRETLIKLSKFYNCKIDDFGITA
jgi:transcriptional regulator with XRE-family HTH domain